MKLLSLFLCGLFLAGCFFSKDKEVGKAKISNGIQEIKGEIFGSFYIIRYVGNLDRTKFMVGLNSFFKEFNDEFSTYQKSSIISQFNTSDINEKLKTSPRFIQMLKISKKLNEKTKGAFDPTLGPVIKLWGFGGGVAKETPSKQSLAAAMKKIGFQHISWDEKSYEVWKTKPGVELDVNAFAPGWAADLMGKLLEDYNVMNYMVDVSGELLIKGEKSPGNRWVVGIEKPSKQYAQGIQLAFRIRDQSVATSGDYRQFFNEKGERRSHIIDPRTGTPVTHKISSATVITDSTLEADAWSTAIMVMGEKGIPIAEANGVKVFLLEAIKPEEYKSIFSSLMQEFIAEAQL